MNATDPQPFLAMNLAPDLPHFGRTFARHGPAGVLTFRIDIQERTHDGHILLGGPVIHGREIVADGASEDRAGQLVTIFVTESQYMRLSDAPLG